MKGPVRQPSMYIAWMNPSQRCASGTVATNVFEYESWYAWPREAIKKVTEKRLNGGFQNRSSCDTSCKTAPRSRVAPKERRRVVVR